MTFFVGECYLEIGSLAPGTSSGGRSASIGIGENMPIFLTHDHHHAWSEAVLRGQARTSPGYGKNQTVYLKVALSFVEP